MPRAGPLSADAGDPRRLEVIACRFERIGQDFALERHNDVDSSYPLPALTVLAHSGHYLGNVRVLQLGELEWDYFEERGVKRTPGLVEPLS